MSSNISDWKSQANIHAIQLRASLYKNIREYFLQKSVLEVETPILCSTTVTDPNIQSISTATHKQFLHTSPEYAMKRLLADIKKDIYQICKVFRDEEDGKKHHPEFTMLEWYRVNWSYKELIVEVEELFHYIFKYKIKFKKSVKYSYFNLFEKYCSINISNAKRDDYIEICKQNNIHTKSDLNIEELQDLCIDQIIATQFSNDCLTIVYDYPKHSSALARLNADGYAERFEVYIGDMELANGFQELTDVNEQLQRFEYDNQQRALQNKQAVDIDQKFIACMENGLPECAGVAVGLDRVLMLLLGESDIKNVLIFPRS